MKSGTLKIYESFLAFADEKDIDFVDSVYALCEANYDAGGDAVVECFTPKEVLESFDALEDVKIYCGAKVEQATNCRLGEDTDYEINRPEWVDVEDTV